MEILLWYEMEENEVNYDNDIEGVEVKYDNDNENQLSINYKLINSIIKIIMTTDDQDIDRCCLWLI